MTVTDIATRQEERALTLSSAALSLQDLLEQKRLIAECMKELMKVNEHYGVIPGTGKRRDADGKELAPKPSLLKPGADLIGFMFRLEADYVNEEVVHEAGYIYYRVKCVLTHIPTGKRVGSGIGSCNSREESFRRPAPKKCPNCGKEAIIKGKEEYGGGWVCFDKKGGCKSKWKDGDQAIEGQATGVADPSDLDNAILKRATKRARVDAILTATAASDFFTQDAEDLAGKAAANSNAIDVEVTDPVVNEHIRGALDEAPKAAPPAAVPASAATTSKPARAPSIAHDGTFASHKQVTLLHVLKSKLGMPECKGDCAREVTEEKKWGKKTTKILRCPYHTQLAAFKDCDGKPITTSKDLSEAQISNLIDRYDAKVNSREARAAEGVDLGPLVSGGGTTTSPAATATGPEAGDTRHTAQAVDLTELRAELDKAGNVEVLVEEICEALRVMTIDDIKTPERAAAALALTVAWGTKSFEQVKGRVISRLTP